ncbi:yoaE [Wigglesworthia glossinidia endosymbiont of Glossina brevipalpis]|uniref:YoaE protein n=1 Tax=Wigglesworthia glossinidia brevipalpis TaxID=36870 RepID=Q8D395_WIGBR|nr:yoaE [Wigglesworthia glossinidia endosymbiont of Glossina brevipalpis]
MTFWTSPSEWAGLLTLVILEIVLGIDNLIFIAILSNKLPPKDREKARMIGLVIALIIRIGLLSLISWIVTLTYPLIKISNIIFSGRDLVLISGGLFLIFKSVTELHERLEQKEIQNDNNKVYTSFWIMIVQIVVLDAVFSLDAIITAVGMVNNLFIMITAVILSLFIMLISSSILTKFINKHKSVVVLCLSFLLLIGFSLIAEGFNYHIPKSYLYTAIVFSILIELFNQISRKNLIKNQSIKSIRERAAEAIVKLMGGGVNYKENNNFYEDISYRPIKSSEEERNMVAGILSLCARSLYSIMTLRKNIVWINTKDSIEKSKKNLSKFYFRVLPVCNGDIDNIIGIINIKDFLYAKNMEQIKYLAKLNSFFIVKETNNILKLLNKINKINENVIFVSDKSGIIQGLITPIDILKAIYTEFSTRDD